MTPNDPYSGRTAPLTSKRCILYIYSTNIGTEYFKHGIYSPFLPLQNAVCFVILAYLVPVLFTFHIHVVLKFKRKYNSGAKWLIQCNRQDIFLILSILFLNSLNDLMSFPVIGPKNFKCARREVTRNGGENGKWKIHLNDKMSV